MLSMYISLFLLVAYINTFGRAIHLDRRDPTASLSDCYDYIIVGGGISGLVVANRLTEDPTVTVLVLEAGNLDHYEDFIQLPFDVGDGLGSSYDWNLWTVDQTYLDGKPRPYDMGKGVGGGSLINGMCWTRGGSQDFDAWEALGNPGWGWNDLLPYFIKAENFTDNVGAEFSHELYHSSDPSMHGTKGYVQVSYPKYFYNQSQSFLDGLHELGIPILADPNNGTAAGGMLIPNTISPENQTRSDARRSYYDGFIDTRPNLHVLSGQLVTRVLIDSPAPITSRDLPAGLFAYGVEFASNVSTPVRNITCSREIILAAGAVHSSQILELSGIGQADYISQYDIPVLVDLPGVGNNLQDHPYVGAVYYYMNSSYLTIDAILNSTGLLNMTKEYLSNQTGPINTVAFPSLPSASKNWSAMIADASSQDPSKYLLPGLDPTITAGYVAQKSLLVSLLSNRSVGAFEILSNNIGLLAVSAMHPFSRGSVHIKSSNPFIQPLIDPRYCSNPLDCQTLVEALLFNNQLINTTAMRLLDAAPYSPFLPGATPETLLPAILSGLRTEFHAVGTTAMVPRELGGVVDTHLRVFGTKNLRVVDAGIFPLIPATHLQAPVFAVAEKAADLIRLDNYALTPEGCGINSSFARVGPVLSFTSYVPNNVPATSGGSPQDSSNSPSYNFIQELEDGSSPSALGQEPLSESLTDTAFTATSDVDSIRTSLTAVITKAVSNTSDELTTTLISHITITKTTTVPLLPSVSTFTGHASTVWAMIEPTRITFPSVGSGSTSISHPPPSSNTTISSSTPPIWSVGAEETSVYSAVVITSNENTTPFMPHTTREQNSTVPRKQTTSTFTTSVSVTTSSMGEPLRYTRPSTRLVSNSSSSSTPSSSATIFSQYVGAQSLSANSSTSQEVTTTMIRHTTLTETTTTRRSTNITRLKSSVPPTALVTWNTSSPVQATASGTAPSTSDTSARIPLAQAASWLYPTNWTWTDKSLARSTSLVGTQIAHMSASSSILVSAKMIYQGLPNSTSTATSYVGTSNPSLPTTKSQIEAVESSNPAKVPANPSHYGHVGFSRHALSVTTKPSISRVVTLTITTTAFATGASGTPKA